MIDTDTADLMAVRSSFCFVIARWRLTQSEVAMLLGSTAGPVSNGRVLPDLLDSAAERRLRLLIRLDRAFDRMCADDDVAVRIRTPNFLENGVTPLEALADERVLRAAIAIAEERADQPPFGTMRVLDGLQ